SAALGRGHRIAAIVHPGAADPQRRRVSREALGGAEVCFEFTRPDAAPGNVEALLAAGCRRIVAGTTGWKDRLPAVERQRAASGAVLVHADNFSLGMALFARVLAVAADLYGEAGYAPWIAEWHHVGKRDAPSGSARSLAEVLERSLPGLRRVEGSVPPEGLP